MAKVKSAMLRRLFKVIIAFFCGTQTVSAAAEPLKILFIGNSYTLNNAMPSIFEKVAKSTGKNIEVTMNAKGGHTFEMHCARPEMFATIKSKKWDYVILQGFSLELSYPVEVIDTATIPYFNKILDSIYTNNPCTNVMLYMTWGYENGHTKEDTEDSFLKMADRVEYGYSYLSELFNIPIVPVGYSWKGVRAQYSDIRLYDADQMHPSIFGSYLAACTFYSAIFKGKVKGPSVYAPKSISSFIAEKIHDVAYQQVVQNLDKFKLHLNTYGVKTESTAKNKYSVVCTSSYPNASNVTWDFGDGTLSNEMNTRHYYAKPGDYIIKLTVSDLCGERVYYKKVHFKSQEELTRKEPKTSTVDQTKKN